MSPSVVDFGPDGVAVEGDVLTREVVALVQQHHHRPARVSTEYAREALIDLHPH